ncbi:MAG: type II secretion system F family protein, partial [Proteobacteria bacterium]|nr:type II secretion system F family protein [Pseudomonadota bacterium]
MTGAASHGLGIDALALYIALGVGVTVLTLGLVFAGFFAERRLRDRLEDLDGRARTGSRTLQLASLRRVDRAGRLASFDKLLWRLVPNAGSIRARLLSAGLKISLGEFGFVCLGIAVAVWVLFSIVLALPFLMALVAAVMLGVGIPYMFVGRMARKRGLKFNLLFPEAVDLIVRALRAGLPVQEAISNVARDIKDPVGSTFRQAQQEMQLGVPLEAALWRAAQTVQTDEFNFLIVALSIQRETGGNLAETLANLSALLRGRQQLRLKIRAFTSEARATMLIMAGLPFIVGGGLFLLSPSYISPLISTPTGLMVI